MTTRQISRSAYAARTSRMQIDVIAAIDIAAAKAAPSVADILHNWTFEACPAASRCNAAGTVAVRAARLASPFNAADVFIVTQDTNGVYSVECPAFRSHWGARVIEAMAAKVAADKARRAN